ncbi:hypothetical protein [Leyella stercorea]|uniref:hypothetical protein n=1 Tax=Leyella stercorea TaxID=363265 RepID=UPI00242DF9C2|nr:hypothetical protein [Leyella stercorea]
MSELVFLTHLLLYISSSSASRIDRCGCLRRPMRMSASTDADVCADRCGCLRRPTRMA